MWVSCVNSIRQPKHVMVTLEPINVSTADSTFSNSNGRDRSPKWSKVTTRWSYRDSDTLASDDSNNAVNQVNHVGGVTSWILYSYRQENSAFNRQSTMAWSHMSNVTWPPWWLSSWLSFCKRSRMTLQNCSGQSLVPTSKWCDTAETVSTMIRQTFETNISSNLHKFNPSFRFLPCRT